MSRIMSCIALAAMLLVSGCKSNNVTTIKTLLDDPSRFDKQTVQVAGTVEQSAGVMGYGVYRITDETGTITVVTNENGAPRTGAKVGVQGEFRSAFTLGSQTLAAIVEKKRYTPGE
jgi:hypothetical protein